MAWNRYRRNKLGNTKVTSLCHYGYTHRSKLERAVCDLIVLREKAGELKHVSHEFRCRLSDAEIIYIADFRCEKNGVPFFIESKGFPTQKWVIVKKLWRVYGLGVLQIYGGSWTKPILIETIIPKSCQK